ncbi:hypothetical protein G4G30_09890 [Stenotrophomonas maltophilia]|nr:hypothetical protein G4G30_09890 [Stenotrophomonas maltophilia]
MEATPGGAVGQGLTSADEGIGGAGSGLMENHGKLAGTCARQHQAMSVEGNNTGARKEKAAMQGIAAFQG